MIMLLIIPIASTSISNEKAADILRKLKDNNKANTKAWRIIEFETISADKLQVGDIGLKSSTGETDDYNLEYGDV